MYLDDEIFKKINEELLEDQEIIGTINKIIKSAGVKESEILLMLFRDGHTVKEVAANMNMRIQDVIEVFEENKKIFKCDEISEIIEKRYIPFQKSVELHSFETKEIRENRDLADRMKLIQKRKRY